MTAKTPDAQDLGRDDVFVQALRQDLPQHEDYQRLHASLLAAGVAVGASAAGLATGGVAAQATGAAKLTGATQAATAQLTGVAGATATSSVTGSVAGATGLWGKLALLPVAAKVGISTTALAVVVTTVTWGAQLGTPSGSAMQAPAMAMQAAEQAAPSQPKTPEPGAERLDVLEPEVLVPSVTTPGGMAPPLQLEPARHRRHRSTSVSSKAVSGLADSAEEPVASNHEVTASTLADEAALLEQSLRALAQGRAASAERLLDLHRQRYPHGALRIERQRAEQQLRAKKADHEPQHPELGVNHE